MRIEDLRFEESQGRARVVATLLWEDCARPVQEVYFETVEEFAGGLSCNPHAFLAACMMPAMYFGETRISIDGEVCPQLRDGLMTVMNLMRFWWYEPSKKLPAIEGKTKSRFHLPPTQERAGVFFSGGIDALATLRSNRLNYPLDHPGSIKDGLLVYGLEVWEPESFGYVKDSVSALAEDARITLIPVSTNIRFLGPENAAEFWNGFWFKFMGAAFSAIAHAFANRLTKVSVSSSHDIPHLIPNGSHPLVEPNYSSSNLEIRHEGITLSRLDKVKLIADWDLALSRLRVCNRMELYQPGILNCGKCEKCVRTMLALLAAGLLEKSSAFPINTVDEELVMATVQLAPNIIQHYEELVSPLKEKGRHDLARAVERKIALYHQSERRKKRRKVFIDPILEYDQKHLGGSLRKLKRIIYPWKGIWTK